MLRVAVALMVTVSVGSTLSSCGIRGLNFVRDDRLSITAPEARSEVRLPMTVRWTVRDFSITGPTREATADAGYFGVFVDRAPPGPGKTLASLADNDPACKESAGCPDEAYLAGQNAYSTTDTTFELARLPELTRDRTREAHEVTIVLLDGLGRRIGESAFRVEFQVRRKIRR